MAVFVAEGGPQQRITDTQARTLLADALDRVPDTSRVLAIPPDTTRSESRGGALTSMLYDLLGRQEPFHVLPALGTHNPMGPQEIDGFFGSTIPPSDFIEHKWREELHRFGNVPSDFVHEVSGDALKPDLPDYDIPVEINKNLVGGDYTAMFSIGQVVPHEVIGMANGVKNVLVGTGGQETINKSHFLGAAYGLERMMGRIDTPVRRVMNYAHEHYLEELGIIYILTVVEPRADGEPVLRGLYIGDDLKTFEKAARLSQQVNLTLLEEPLEKTVVYLSPDEFKSTWLGNKAIYRTRMAMADDGELIVLGPGVEAFGEDPEIDRLIREYGYRGTPATLKAVRENDELRDNLAAAAHLIHGSSEGRFQITYATDPDLLGREEVENVGFEWMDVHEALEMYPTEELTEGWNDGFFYVSNPALGLWALEEDF